MYKRQDQHSGGQRAEREVENAVGYPVGAGGGAEGEEGGLREAAQGFVEGERAIVEGDEAAVDNEGGVRQAGNQGPDTAHFTGNPAKPGSGPKHVKPDPDARPSDCRQGEQLSLIHI